MIFFLMFLLQNQHFYVAVGSNDIATGDGGFITSNRGKNETLNKLIRNSIDDGSAVACPNTATCRFLAPGKKRAVALVEERSYGSRSLSDPSRQVAKSSVYLRVHAGKIVATVVSRVMSSFGISKRKTA